MSVHTSRQARVNKSALKPFRDQASITTTGGVITPYGNFSREEFEQDVGGGASVASSLPVFIGLTSDLSTVKKGDALVVNSASFTVAIPPEEDGTGMTKLILYTA